MLLLLLSESICSRSTVGDEEGELEGEAEELEEDREEKKNNLIFHFSNQAFANSCGHEAQQSSSPGATWQGLKSLVAVDRWTHPPSNQQSRRNYSKLMQMMSLICSGSCRYSLLPLQLEPFVFSCAAETLAL